jgi:hypothetical protein
LPAMRGVVHKRHPLAGDHRSGHLGRPADFLVAPDGRVLARKYGVHAFDQWTVDELLAQAGTARQVGEGPAAPSTHSPL